MNAAAYLDADACALADREHTNTNTNTPRALTAAYLAEMEYAVTLLRRADSALSAELAVLRGLDIGIDWNDLQRACHTLVSTAVLLHLRVQLERAGRPAC